jgi:hypothetical protein
MLSQPHSTFLLLVAELGVVGALFAVLLIGSQVRLLALCRLRHADFVFAAGVVGAVLALVFDLLLFKGVVLSAVWWVYYCGSCELAAGAREGAAHTNPVRWLTCTNMRFPR